METQKQRCEKTIQFAKQLADQHEITINQALKVLEIDALNGIQFYIG